MIEIKDELLQSILINPRITGSGSHYIADCPFCNKEGHLYVQRKTNKKNKRGQNVSYFWECKKCSESGMIFKLLRALGRSDLIKFKPSINTGRVEKKINIVEEQEDLNLDLPKKSKPLGFKYVVDDPYLVDRDFSEEQHTVFSVGRTKLLSKLKDYVIFLCMEESECKGYVARSTWSNEKIKKFNKKAKEQKQPKHLRYSNSPNTDFALLLFGYDEITEGVTDTVILVEGITDKANVDRLLDLYRRDDMKCCATFGKKCSDYQIAKLQKKGVKNIILLYDPDAVDNSKEYSMRIAKYFDVQVGYLSGDKDPGCLNIEELSLTLSSLESPLSFRVSKVAKKKLL